MAVKGVYGLVFNWCRCASGCNNGCASLFNSATIFAGFLHLCIIGSPKFGKCDVASIFLLILFGSRSWCSGRSNHVTHRWLFWCWFQKNLVKKILKFEFVEMYELLLETWLQGEDESGGMEFVVSVSMVFTFNEHCSERTHSNCYNSSCVGMRLAG